MTLDAAAPRHYLYEWGQIQRRNSLIAFDQRARAHAQQVASAFPASLARHLLDGWSERFVPAYPGEERPKVAPANRWINEQARDLKAARYRAAYDEATIRDHAENYAALCERMSSLENCRAYGAWFGIEPPKARNMTDASERARWNDALWWRRQLRKAWTRESENAMRALGAIRKGKAAYASDEAVHHRQARAARTREWMADRVMVNGQGDQLELLDIADKSMANPALRRGEFMCRMRGFEEIAADLGHVALFWTLTAPSAFHAQHSHGGVNAAWEAAARPRVRDAQAWLRRMWARARAKLARLSVRFYGFRVAEPHHDATPHWHMVLFIAPAQADALQFVLREVWLSEYADEPGAREHRCKCVAIDPEQGSATGYVAKYVSKNIDGAGAIGEGISDETGAPVIDGVQRVAAWAAVHGIRQFQQLGGPPVGLWRELRRLRDPLQLDAIEAARTAADGGDWAGFIRELGGLERASRRVACLRSKYRRDLVRVPRVLSEARGPRGGKRYRPALPGELPAVWLERTEARTTDRAGREVVAVTRYGEEPAPRAVGVVAFGLLGRYQCADTRTHRWRIEKKCTGTAASSSAAGSSKTGGFTAGASTAARAIRATDGMTGIGSDSSPRSGVRSDLGPVAITVRSAPVAGEPSAWTNPRETSRAGPTIH